MKAAGGVTQGAVAAGAVEVEARGEQVETIHLSCAADAAYVKHSAAMLHSALVRRGSRRMHIHYLTGPRFPARSAARLREMVERAGGRISFLTIEDERVAELPVLDFISSPMWYRIFLPSLLPDLDRILYLDVDTIVVDGLAPLWTSDLADNYLAAVTNVLEPGARGHPAELGLSGPHEYFSSGVLLMNLEQMRRDGSTEALYRFAVDNRDRIVWPDQDTLNMVLGHRRLPLHPRWNVTNAMLAPWGRGVFPQAVEDEAIRQPAIRHFEGPYCNKPWHLLCERELRETYYEHRRQTPWPWVRPEGITPRNVAKRVARSRRLRRPRAASA